MPCVSKSCLILHNVFVIKYCVNGALLSCIVKCYQVVLTVLGITQLQSYRTCPGPCVGQHMASYVGHD